MKRPLAAQSLSLVLIAYATAVLLLMLALYPFVVALVVLWNLLAKFVPASALAAWDFLRDVIGNWWINVKANSPGNIDDEIERRASRRRF